MLVRVMSNVILRCRDFFVLAIIGHSRIAPLEWQHKQNQQGQETSHEIIMPDNYGVTIFELLN